MKPRKDKLIKQSMEEIKYGETEPIRHNVQGEGDEAGGREEEADEGDNAEAEHGEAE